MSNGQLAQLSERDETLQRIRRQVQEMPTSTFRQVLSQLESRQRLIEYPDDGAEGHRLLIQVMRERLEELDRESLRV